MPVLKKKSAKTTIPKKSVKSVKSSIPKRSLEEEQKSEYVYPDIKSRLCIGDKAITMATAKTLLGWHEEGENTKFKNDYTIKDAYGTKIRCLNNSNNRPIYSGNLEALKQEHLRRKWRFNGEPIIIGKSGKILNGQHSLISFILACQEWDLHGGKWIDWQEEPTMEKLIVVGVDESDETVNTMDTCKPRSLSDVLYRSEFFASKSKGDRKIYSRITTYAINTLWSRMGAKHAFAPRQTHMEAIGFLEKHPKILECVEHIAVENNDEGKENKDSQIGKYLAPGYAAGMMYLMGQSNSDPKLYLSDSCEESLDWSNWDAACDFFVLLANGEKTMAPLKQALGRILADEGGSREERFALIVKAWLSFLASGRKSLDPKQLVLRYETDEDQIRTLAEKPSVGGIDLIEFSKETTES